MAVDLITPEDTDDNKDKKKTTSQPGSAFSSVGPSQQARAAQTAGPATKGSGFIGAGKYLQANTGGRLGQEVFGRIQDIGKQTEQRLKGAVGQFNTEFSESNIQSTKQQEAAKKALERISSGYKDDAYRKHQASLPVMSGGLKEKYDKWRSTVHPMDHGPGSASERSIKTAEEAFLNSLTPEERSEYNSRQYNPQKQFDVTPDEQAAYAALTSGQYQGPAGLQGVENIQTQADVAAKMAQSAQTGQGRLGLLRQTIGRASSPYTAGQAALDNLVLGQQAKNFSGLGREALGLSKKIGREETLAEAKARQLAETTKGYGEQLKSKASAAEKGYLSSIAGAKKTFEDKQQEAFKLAQDELASGEISQQTAGILSSLGIDPNAFYYGDPGNFLSKNITKTLASQYSSATPEQAAQLNALKRLAGQKDLISEEELKTVGSTTDPLKTFQLAKDSFKVYQEGQKPKDAIAGQKPLSSDVVLAKENELVQGLSSVVNNPWADYVTKDVLKKDPSTGSYTKESLEALKNDIDSRLAQEGIPFSMRENLNKLNTNVSDLLKNKLAPTKQFKIKKLKLDSNLGPTPMARPNITGVLE